MRFARLLSCCCAAALALGCSGPDPGPGRANAPGPALAGSDSPTTPLAQPRIVVQLGHGAPVVAVRWVDDGRHLASIARDGSLVFWQVADGVILDHAQVPIDPRRLLPQGMTPPALRFHALDEGPAAGTLAITFAAATVADAARDCPEAHRAGTPWCGFLLDLATRAVRADASLPVPAADTVDADRHWPPSPDGRLRPEPNHGDGRRGLPDLADEHFGSIDPSCTALDRCRYGVTLLASDGGVPPRAFTADPRGFFLDAELSADGLRLLRVERPFNAEGARVEILDLGSGRSAPAFAPAQAYHQVRWLDEQRYLLTSEGYAATDDTEDALAGFPPALVVEPGCAARGDCPRLESRWQLRPSADGGFLGLGPLADHCYRARFGGTACIFDDLRPDDGHETYDPPATGLVALDGASALRRLAQDALEDQVTTAIETSPDRLQVAVATRVRDHAQAPGAKQVLRVWLMDAAGRGTPRLLAEATDRLGDAPRFTDEDSIRALSFSADGRHLVFSQYRGATQADLHLLDLATGTPARIVPGFARRAVALGTQRVLGLDDGVLLDLASGERIATLDAPLPLARAGWIERSDLLWATAADGAIRFWDAGDGRAAMALHLLAEQRFFALTPDGRYDTNLAADTALVRWLVPDAPWRSLAAQTFMRDYYEPGLYRRLLDCRGNGSCAEAFPPLPAIAALNRVLPQVRITGVQASADGTEATVSVELREGVDAQAANGRTRSGLFNPRLFRNGRLVAAAPRVEVPSADDALAAWRASQAVPAADGVARLAFTVPLPTGDGGRLQAFSAYAFNEDRIKGDTARLDWERPPAAPRPRRAYVLAIGIDAYDTPRFRLGYAVADARLMASRLAGIPGHEVRSLVLAAAGDARVDRATILHALSLLAGEPGREATLASLRAGGIDASTLAPATPDDTVIISFSGHGWANPQGDFYLIPGDGRWPVGEALPDLSTLVSTQDLVTRFQAMQAGEIALVIDACHSAASVADGRFKPGPMGDSGLGQLAFDKGLRILAATQADDVAMEDARLGQGLLTYALAVDGLGAGRADVDGDGRLRMDEWLGYAVDRLPGLAVEIRTGRLGGAARAIRFSDTPPDAPLRRVQQPALFDFNPQPSPVLLRDARR